MCLPIWSCSVRGLACHACCQTRGGLLPHLFTLPRVAPGGLFSVPLSVGSPRPGVTRRTALWSSDFPLLRALRPLRSGYSQQRSLGSLRQTLNSQLFDSTDRKSTRLNSSH